MTPDFSINPDASLLRQEIDNHNDCLIVDDFLLDPDSIVRFAEENVARFSTPSMSYPGVVMDVCPRLLPEIQNYLRRQMSRQFSFLRGGIDTMTLLSMTTFQPKELSNLQRLCHSDPRTRMDRENFAGLLYLFRDETLGGTGFYRWKNRPEMEQATALEMQDPEAALEFLKERYPTYNEPAQYITESNEIAELIALVPARYNRWVFYSGDLPHSAYITSPEMLSSDFATGRLTLNLFASVISKLPR